jgi:hypothetical protein
MWLLPHSTLGGGVQVYDGATWVTYSKATGLPADVFTTIFADSAGRIWIGLRDAGANNPAYVYLAMHDQEEWHFYGASETSDHLRCEVSQIWDAPNGDVWFQTCAGVAVYDGHDWVAPPFEPELTYSALFDSHGNFWYSRLAGGGDLIVRWGGTDYSFADGVWLSPMRFQASLDFDANVPPGQYVVGMHGARGSDNLPVQISITSTFQVDYAGSITLNPPLAPTVVAQTDGNLYNIAATWQVSDASIAGYRYAINAGPGDRDVIGWTYVAGASMVRNDLQLVSGRRYYVTVQAQGTNGLWSVDGVSGAVVAGQTVQHLYLPVLASRGAVSEGLPPIVGGDLPSQETPIVELPETPPTDGANRVYLPEMQR